MKQRRKNMHVHAWTVGKQPVAPGQHPPTTLTRSHAQTLRHAGKSQISEHDWLGQQFLQEQKALEKEEETDTLSGILGPISTADLSPSVFTTSAAVPQSLQSYAPTDTRANPIIGANLGASGGFLPAPPV